MARVHIQVDLKEHEILEKQLRKEFEGIAREMARQAMKEELEKEIDRLIENKLKEAQKSDYYNTIATHITKIVALRISQDVQIDTNEVNKLVQDKVESYINNIMQKYGGTQDFIRSYINKSIADALRK